MLSSDTKRKNKENKPSDYKQLNFEDLPRYSTENTIVKNAKTNAKTNAKANENAIVKNTKKNIKDEKDKKSKAKIKKAKLGKSMKKLVDLYHSMSNYERKEWESQILLVAGLDEVGRGPLAGPVVAAACILDPENPILGINDSKKLTEKKREELFIEIQNKAVCYSIVRIEHDVIDEVNILNATKMAMVECVRILCLKPGKLLIDAIDLKGTGIPVIAIIKGDSLSVSIAAASILAKVTRDRIMVEFDNVYPGYGFIQNKGYGTTLHYDGIKKLGITPIHRKSFLKGWEGSF